jgi:hypothetical protein
LFFSSLTKYTVPFVIDLCISCGLAHDFGLTILDSEFICSGFSSVDHILERRRVTKESCIILDFFVCLKSVVIKEKWNIRGGIQNIPDWCRHLLSSCGSAKHREVSSESVCQVARSWVDVDGSLPTMKPSCPESSLVVWYSVTSSCFQK